ncbi:MAG: hypothetical protein MJ252_08525 [archaeon]|nr:hypothetical protein [archaeon]
MYKYNNQQSNDYKNSYNPNYMNQNMPQYVPPMNMQFQNNNNQFNQSPFNNYSSNSGFQQQNFQRNQSVYQPTFFNPSPMKFGNFQFGQNKTNEQQRNPNLNLQFSQRPSQNPMNQSTNYMSYQPSDGFNYNSNAQNNQMNFNQGHSTTDFNKSFIFENSFNDSVNTSFCISNDNDVNMILIKGLTDLNPRYATDIFQKYATLVDVQNVSKSQGAFLFKFKGSFDEFTKGRILEDKALYLERRYPHLDIKFLSKNELDQHQLNLSRSYGNLSFMNQPSVPNYGYNSNAYVNSNANENWASDGEYFGAQDNKPFWKYLLDLLFNWD